MLARVKSGALTGIDAVVVDVEIDMSLGLPYFNVVGLPEGAVKESKVRVISALKNTGFELPQKRITVNLAPADIRKEGAAFELPIALGVLCASRLLDEEPLSTLLFAGELSLDGVVKPIRGALPLAVAARNAGFKGVMLPAANAHEAALVDQIDVLPVNHVRDAVDHLTGANPITPFRRTGGQASARPTQVLDMADVRGQPDLKLFLEVAAAGSHNLLMCGPPGSGKTMLARRLPGILPSLTFQEALEITKIYSVLGLVPEGEALMTERPFRSPHHTISDAGLIGGGPLGRPGELSMAHHGVLFLDELPEFKKNVLEVLRQPLEEGVVHLARANHNIAFPCRVMLVAAMNPCPCGWFNTEGRTCSCPPSKRSEYYQRVSGPLMDRVDISVQTRPVEQSALVDMRPSGKPSAWYRSRVEAARERQRARFKDLPGIHSNAQMGPRELRQFCTLTTNARKLLVEAVRQHHFSARAHDRILKVARTKADLEGHADITEADMCFAIDSRAFDRRSWYGEELSLLDQKYPVDRKKEARSTAHA
ncbi:MAG: YifB family Mg chelatase-like AAA ATPase [Myxococcaceae bacterium]|nr:YifB family Mg chelatase-like AAA ATPase [Myxococcaceae bacterium]